MPLIIGFLLALKRLKGYKLHMHKALKRLSTPVGFSAILHLLLFLLIPHLSQIENMGFPTSVQEKPKPIAISTISRDQLQKLKRLGVKKGSKDYQLPLENKKGTDKGDVALKKGNTLDFKKLTPDPDESAKIAKKFDKESDLNTEQKKNNYNWEADEQKIVNIETSTQSTGQSQTKTIKELGITGDQAKIFRRTNLDISFEPPEGVSEDELNEASKRYYIFQKRSYVKYLNSFFKTYHRLVLSKPQLKQNISKWGMHRLTGRVIFDKEGNIVSIKILKSSTNDNIHQLFEETLKEIGKLHNPPKDYFVKEDQFTIYYQITINQS